MAEYGAVQKGSLKLKGVSDAGIKKKKKKKKDKKKVFDQMVSATEASSSQASPSVDKRTPAELAFAKAHEKRSTEVIAAKAAKTHKERIMDFNRHLDCMTEHFDIPKVSWTK